jgi:hypothetical protein
VYGGLLPEKYFSNAVYRNIVQIILMREQPLCLYTMQGITYELAETERDAHLASVTDTVTGIGLLGAVLLGLVVALTVPAIFGAAVLAAAVGLGVHTKRDRIISAVRTRTAKRTDSVAESPEQCC